ncbi:hypothetical protein ACOSP7_013386 [Xanthoceras sorbifolium]
MKATLPLQRAVFFFQVLSKGVGLLEELRVGDASPGGGIEEAGSFGDGGIHGGGVMEGEDVLGLEKGWESVGEECLASGC